MDFIVGLPRSKIGFSSVFVVSHTFRMVIHFMPCKITHDASNIANSLFKEVVRIHGIPMSIVTHRDVRFMGNFWKTM